MYRFRFIVMGFIAGLWVGWRLFGQHSQYIYSQADAQPTSPVNATKPSFISRQDDLTQIEGIGPAFARALNAVGVLTFAQLAQQDADSLAGKLAVRVTSERIRRDRWIEQAQTLST